MVIFDMDGVIIDSERIYHYVEMKLFKKLGLDISEEERSSYIGTKTTEMWAEIKQNHFVEHPVKILVEMENSEFTACLKSEQNLKPMRGIVELIRELHGNGIILALASSSCIELIEVILGMFDLKKYYTFILSGDDVENGKPAPDIFNAVCRQAGIAPQNCIVIEDSKNGVLSAKAAGIKCIGYQNSGSGDQDLSSADMVIPDFNELSCNILKDLVSPKNHNLL